MQAETSPDPIEPALFDQMVAEGGNPLGGHADMPRPRFNLGVPITDWPRLDDPSGEMPTIEFPAIPDESPSSALAQLDSGGIPSATDTPTED